MTIPVLEKDNEICIQRTYEASLQNVWNAWSDPQQKAQWWGPRGFTITTHNYDLRTNGTWHYTMHGPDGTDYINKTKYLEVTPLSRMIYDHGGNDDQPALFRVTVNFQEVDSQTTVMTMTMALGSKEAAEQTKKFVRQAHGDSTWDRLAEFLEKSLNHQEVFVMHRSFPLAADQLQKYWTDSTLLEKWLPPPGLTMNFIKCDIRAGGQAFYKMSNHLSGSDQVLLFGRSQYLTIEPYKMVYLQQFCDESGKVSRHPMAPTWPETMKATIQFVSEGEKRCRVKVLWQADGNLTLEELNTFVSSRSGMMMGWSSSFDQLEDLF